MRKIFLFALMSSFILPMVTRAAIVGSSDLLEKGKCRIELESEYIKRNLEVAVGYLLKKDASGNVEADSTILGGSDGTQDLINNKGVSQRDFVKISYGAFKNLDIYTRLGTADFESDYDHYTNKVLDGLENPVSDYGFAYGLGLKSNLYEFSNGLKIGIDTQYLRHKNDGNFYVTNPTTGIRGDAAHWTVADQFWPNTASASYDYESIIQEWQLAIYVSRDFRRFSPYLGLKYSDYIAKVDVSGYGYDSSGSITGSQREKFHYEAEDNLGIFLGTGINFTEKVSANIEGRFIDEEAVSVSLSYKF